MTGQYHYHIIDIALQNAHNISSVLQVLMAPQFPKAHVKSYQETRGKSMQFWMHSNMLSMNHKAAIQFQIKSVLDDISSHIRYSLLNGHTYSLPAKCLSYLSRKDYGMICLSDHLGKAFIGSYQLITRLAFCA